MQVSICLLICLSPLSPHYRFRASACCFVSRLLDFSYLLWFGFYVGSVRVPYILELVEQLLVLSLDQFPFLM